MNPNDSIGLKAIHHLAIICSDYKRSKEFYTQILGLSILRETYRKEKDSYKLDLALQDQYCIKLFSFSHPPERQSHPEACGLRHLAFEVIDLDIVIEKLSLKGISAEAIRQDEFTQKRFTFIFDPDKLPIELYEK